MGLLRQSTSATRRIGPFIDDTDGKTAEIALSIAQADIRLSKNGGDLAQSNDASGATHDENGWYYLQLDATDTNTLGQLIVAVHVSGALPVWWEFTVLPANEYDSLVLGTDALDVEVASMAADSLTASALAASAVTEIAEGAAITAGNCPAGSTYNNILLAAAEPVTDDLYNGCLVTIVAGTGLGQARLIADYVGSSRSAVVDNPWTTAPADDSDYRIYPFSGILLADTGLAAAATASTITLSASAPAIADTYIGHTIFISGGTGIGQARIIAAYTNTRIATVSPDWTTTPNTTSIYMILPVGRTFVDAVADNAITAAAIAASALDSDVVTAALANKVADHVLRRTYANVRASGNGDAVSYRSGLGAMAKLVNKLEVSGSNLLLYHEDDVTAIGTQVITTDSGADPITGLDTS